MIQDNTSIQYRPREIHPPLSRHLSSFEVRKIRNVRESENKTYSEDFASCHLAFDTLTSTRRSDKSIQQNCMNICDNIIVYRVKNILKFQTNHARISLSICGLDFGMTRKMAIP